MAAGLPKGRDLQMKASWVLRFSSQSALWWVLGVILVSAGAGATTAAVTDPPVLSASESVYSTKLAGTTTIVSNQAVSLGAPSLTGPGPSYAPLPGDWRAFARISDKKDGFQASVRAPYGSILVLHMPLSSTANKDVPLRMKLDVPDGFDVDLAPATSAAAQYTNLVGDAGNNSWYINIPAGASIELELSIKVPMSTGVFNLHVELDPES